VFFAWDAGSVAAERLAALCFADDGFIAPLFADDGPGTRRSTGTFDTPAFGGADFDAPFGGVDFDAAAFGGADFDFGGADLGRAGRSSSSSHSDLTSIVVLRASPPSVLRVGGRSSRFRICGRGGSRFFSVMPIGPPPHDY
jgi:hypothetical protein